ncbi:hypothetical protein HUF15_48865, partial [Streptomyces samsunensis]|uniref:hypothetical protein n=1 Tax=Streptomyces malaysiensis TaxID=92644 RepID=UPI00158157F3
AGALGLRLRLGPTRVLGLRLGGVGRPAPGPCGAVGRYGLASYGQAPALLRLGRAPPVAGAVLRGDEPGRAELRRHRAGLRPVGGGRGQREGGADETGLPGCLRLRLGLALLWLWLWLGLRLAGGLRLGLLGRRRLRRIGQC